MFEREREREKAEKIFVEYIPGFDLPAKQSIPWDLAMTATTITTMMMMATMMMAITGPVPAAKTKYSLDIK